MTDYVVTAQYVTLKVKDQAGGNVMSGFHAGAMVPKGVDKDNLQHHLDRGLVAEVGTEEADLLGVPAGTPIPGEPPNVPVTEQSAANAPTSERTRLAREASEQQAAQPGNSRPAGNAGRDAWAAYAETQGSPAEETRPVDEGGLSRDELRTKYGTGS